MPFPHDNPNSRKDEAAGLQDRRQASARCKRRPSITFTFELIILLSLPRGTRVEHYAGWDKYVAGRADHRSAFQPHTDDATCSLHDPS